MPWVAGEVGTRKGQESCQGDGSGKEGKMRRWSVAERIQEWEVGDKNCVTSVIKRRSLSKDPNRLLGH